MKKLLKSFALWIILSGITTCIFWAALSVYNKTFNIFNYDQKGLDLFLFLWAMLMIVSLVVSIASFVEDDSFFGKK